MFDKQNTTNEVSHDIENRILTAVFNKDNIDKDVTVATTSNRHEVSGMNDEERQLFFEDYFEKTGQHHDMDFIVEKVVDGKDDRFSEIAEDIEPSHFARFDDVAKLGYQPFSPEEIADKFARDLTILVDSKSTSRG